MTLTPKQREKYGRMLVDSGASGFIAWERLSEGRQHWYAKYAEAVALAAQRDLIEQTKEYYRSGDTETYVIWGDILAWLDSYLRADPSPQEDQ